jgi:hypothetical protein
LPRHKIAGTRPGRYEQLIFRNDDPVNEEDGDEDMGYFSPYVPGPYDEVNRY